MGPVLRAGDIMEGKRLRERLGLIEGWTEAALTEGLKGGDQRCGQVKRHHKEEEGICIWSG